MGQTTYIVGGIAIGVSIFAFAITMILTSVIITSSIEDTYIKPGEQVRICKNKEFTVNPAMDGVIGHIFPTGIDYNATEVRIANEVLDGTVKSKKMFDVTDFRANTEDTILMEFESASYSKVEVYYFKKMRAEKAKEIINGDTIRPYEVAKGGNENTIAPKDKPGYNSRGSIYTTLRIVALRINGTGLISGDAIIPEDSEYWIGVVSMNGTTGYDYSINITYARKYYTSNETVNCTSGVKTTLNSEKKKGYCAVFEMEYDAPITDPKASKNKLGLFCPERYSTVDIIVLPIIACLAVVFIIIASVHIGISIKYDRKDVEMS